MEDGDLLFRALVARREAVHNLLVATSQLSKQLTGLVQDTRADLKPALDNLQNVVDVLNANSENPELALEFLKVLTGDNFQTAYGENGLIPSRVRRTTAINRSSSGTNTTAASTMTIER